MADHKVPDRVISKHFTSGENPPTAGNDMLPAKAQTFNQAVESEHRRIFREQIGSTFKKNRFEVEINFITKSGTHIASQVLNGFAKDDGQSFTNLKIGDSFLWDSVGIYGIPHHGDIIKESRAGIFFMPPAVGFSCPGHTLTYSSNVFYYTKYPVSHERGNLTVDIVNDEYNFAWQFWNTYLKMITSFNLIRFYDDYKFNISCKILNGSMNQYIIHRFLGCSPISLGDEEFGYSLNNQVPVFKLDIDYRYHNIEYVASEIPETLKVNDRKEVSAFEIYNGDPKEYYKYLWENQQNYYFKYFKTRDKFYKVLRTIQNALALTSNLNVPLVGEIGKFVPFGPIITMAIAFTLGLTFGKGRPGPTVVVAGGVGMIGGGQKNAADALVEKSTIDISSLTSGDVMTVINSISEGTLLNKQVEYIIAWIRGVIKQEAIQKKRDKVIETDFEGKVAASNVFPLSGTKGFRYLETDNESDVAKAKGNEFVEGTPTLTQDDALPKARQRDMNRYGHNDYHKGQDGAGALDRDKILDKSSKMLGAPNRATNTSQITDATAADGGLTKWHQTKYGPLSDSVQNDNKQSSKVHTLKDDGFVTNDALKPAPNPTSSKSTDFKSTTPVPLDATKFPTKRTADGGLVDWKQTKYGPLSDSVQNDNTETSRAHTLKDDGFVTNDSLSPAPNPPASKSIDFNSNTPVPVKETKFQSKETADGGIGKWKKTTYGPINDSTLGAYADGNPTNNDNMSSVTFSPADQLKVVAQINNFVDGGLAAWHKTNYGAIGADAKAKNANGDPYDNVNLASTTFEAAIELVNSPIIINDDAKVFAAQSALAQLHITRSTEGKIIVNDLSNPAVAEQQYRLFLKRIMKIFEIDSSNIDHIDPKKYSMIDEIPETSNAATHISTPESNPKKINQFEKNMFKLDDTIPENVNGATHLPDSQVDEQLIKDFLKGNYNIHADIERTKNSAALVEMPKPSDPKSVTNFNQSQISLDTVQKDSTNGAQIPSTSKTFPDNTKKNETSLTAPKNEKIVTTTNNATITIMGKYGLDADIPATQNTKIDTSIYRGIPKILDTKNENVDLSNYVRHDVESANGASLPASPYVNREDVVMHDSKQEKLLPTNTPKTDEQLIDSDIVNYYRRMIKGVNTP